MFASQGIGPPTKRTATKHNFIVARNTRASAALGELALVIPACGTEQFSRYLLLTNVRLWNLLPTFIFTDGSLSSFKSAMNLCLLRA